MKLTEQGLREAFDCMGRMIFQEDAGWPLARLIANLFDTRSHSVGARHRAALRLALAWWRLNGDRELLGQAVADHPGCGIAPGEIDRYLAAATCLAGNLDGPYPELHRCSIEQLAELAHLEPETFHEFMTTCEEPAALSVEALRDGAYWLCEQHVHGADDEA